MQGASRSSPGRADKRLLELCSPRDRALGLQHEPRQAGPIRSRLSGCFWSKSRKVSLGAVELVELELDQVPCASTATG